MTIDFVFNFKFFATIQLTPTTLRWSALSSPAAEKRAGTNHYYTNFLKKGYNPFSAAGEERVVGRSNDRVSLLQQFGHHQLRMPV